MKANPGARRYAVVSGKGGVGKTMITANLAGALAAGGNRTLVLDADLGLANLDVILGVTPAGTVHDVISGTQQLDRVLLHTPAGFDLLPAGSGSLEATLLTPELAEGLEQLLDVLAARYDVILFDAGAGVGEIVLYFARLADEIVLVVTPEPTSMMDAYATVKILSRRFGCRDFLLVVNQADPERPEQSGAQVASHLQQVAARFLSRDGHEPVRLQHLGSLPADPSVAKSISRQCLLVEQYPHAPAATRLVRLAESLLDIGGNALAATQAGPDGARQRTP